MKKMKLRRNIFVMIAAFSLASCSSNELEYADVEAHEKTEALQEKYVPLIVGSWYKESINDKQRFYEQLTFNADGTLTGMVRSAIPTGKTLSRRMDRSLAVGSWNGGVTSMARAATR